MSESQVVYVASNGTPTWTPEPGMIRQVLAFNSKLMVVRHNFEAGWMGARHSHPHEQLVYVVSGRIIFKAEGKQWEMGPGDSIVVDGSLEHEASATEPSEVLDVFTPYREDYAK